MKLSLNLISRFNTNNIGDIVIANTLKRELSQFGNINCISLFGRPKFHQNVETTIKYKKNRKSNSFLETILRNIQKNIFLNWGIKKGSFVIIGGGNAMVDVKATTLSASRFIPYINAAKKKNCSLAAIDIGIGPFVNDKQKKMAIDILNQMKFISFRDEYSKKLYEDSNGTTLNILSVDPAFFFMEKENAKKLLLRRKIGINLLNRSLIENNEELVSKCLEGYWNLGNKLAELLNADIFYYVTDETDIPFLEKIESCIQDERLHVKYIEGVHDLLQFYDEIDVVIGTRMHSIILAYSRHVPIVGLNWQNKVSDLFSLLECQDRLFTFDELNINFTSIISTIAEIYHNYEVEQEKIFEVYKKLKKRHENSRNKLSEFLEGKLNEN